MISRLPDLDRVWRSADPDSYASLNAPFTTAQFEELAALTKRAIPDDYRSIFEWKGGQSASAGRGLLPEWRLMQFQEIKMEYGSTVELYDMHEFRNPEWWQPDWLPLLTNEEGTTICLDSLGAFGGRPGQLIHFVSDGPDRTIWFPDMDAMIGAAISGFEDSAALRFPDGYPIARKA
jgi:cell wall assembly regulator SMI1